MFPSEQHLGTDTASLRVDLRLEIQLELLFQQGLMHILVQSGTQLQRLLHGGIEEAQRRAPAVLGLIQRHIGMLEQFVHALLATVEQRHADTGRAMICLAIEHIGQIERHEHLGRHRFGARHHIQLGIEQIGQHHHELVPAQPGHRIPRAHAGEQPVRHFDQQLVADIVASVSFRSLKLSRSMNSTAP